MNSITEEILCKLSGIKPIELAITPPIYKKPRFRKKNKVFDKLIGGVLYTEETNRNHHFQ